MTKKPWYSKSVWTNLVIALAAFYPPVSEFIVSNPTLVVAAFGVVNVVLRLITKEKIST